jgi:ketosteroid isomerase-like protein
VARNAAAYAAIWEPILNTVRSTRHVVSDEPAVLPASGDLTASTLEFAAWIEGGDAEVTAIRTRSDLVWRCWSGQWRIVREHNSTRVVPLAEVTALSSGADARRLKRIFTMPKLSSLSAALLSVATLATPIIATRASAQAPASAETRNEQIVSQAFDRWAAGGTGFFQELLSPDVVWTIKGSGPSAGVFRGRQNFIDRAVTPFAKRLLRGVRPTVRDIWSEGDQVVVHWDGEGTARDGGPYSNSYVWIFRMRGGQAVEAIAFLDLAPYDDVLQRIPAE